MMTVEEKIDFLVNRFQGMEEKLQHWEGNPVKRQAPGGRKRPGPFKTPPKRSLSPGRTELLVSYFDRSRPTVVERMFRAKFAEK